MHNALCDVTSNMSKINNEFFIFGYIQHQEIIITLLKKKQEQHSSGPVLDPEGETAV